MVMSKVEIKDEINKIIDGLPDDLLNDLLVYLQEVEKKPASSINLVANFRKILNEDRNLLHRLAQ